MTDKQITQKEWRQYIEGQMHHHGFSQTERDAVRSAFDSHLKDADPGQRRGFFSTPQAGVSSEEVGSTFNALKDKNSTIPKGLKVHLSEDKLNKLHGILNEALDKNKERWF